MSDKVVEAAEQCVASVWLNVQGRLDIVEAFAKIIREAMTPGVHECSDCRKTFTDAEDGAWELCTGCYRGTPPAPELPCLPEGWEGPFEATHAVIEWWNITDGCDDWLFRESCLTMIEADFLAALLNAAHQAQKGNSDES